MLKEKAAKNTIKIIYALLFLTAAGLMLAGRYKITLADIAGMLSGQYEGAAAHVLKNIRFPRVMAAVLVGGALAVSGASYQGIFKNPMVSPSLLGVSAGAGFGAALAIIMKLSAAWVKAAAFIFGIAAVAIVYFAGSLVSKGNNKTLTIVLVGIVVSSLFSALVALLKYVGDPLDDLPAITFWLMGSLSGVMLDDLLPTAVPIVIGIAGLFFVKWRINIMSLSDEEALSLGVPVARIRLITIACSTLITASAVSVSGQIGWVGLVIPHIARKLVGNDYKFVLPASAAFGGIYLLLIDMVSRSVFPVEVPLGILTSIIGTPVFIFIMLKRRKNI